MEFKNQYLTYEEYKQLGGTLEETPFAILELEAQKNVDKYTTGKLINLEQQTNEIKICVFELIKLINNYNESEDKIGYSENTDGYNISYNGTNENTAKAKIEEIKSIIKSTLSECYLEDGTPYLYVGV